jgi:hypothetical protein
MDFSVTNDVHNIFYCITLAGAESEAGPKFDNSYGG